MDLIVLYGIPGVGKHAVGKSLEHLTGYTLLHNGLYTNLLSAFFDFGSAPFCELRDTFWKDIVRTGCRNGIKGIILTYAYDPSIGKGLFLRLRKTIVKSGGKMAFFELTAHSEKRNERVGGKEIGILTFLRRVRNAEESSHSVVPARTVHRTIETDIVEAHEAAMHIMRILKSEGILPD